MPNERVAELIARKRQLVEELQDDVPNRSLTATERLAKVQEIRSSFDEIIETEAGQRLLTLGNLLLRSDELGVLDGAILTPFSEEQLLTQDEIVLLVEQS